MWKDYRKGGFVGAGVMPEAAKPLLPGERIVDAFVADIMSDGPAARTTAMSKDSLDETRREAASEGCRKKLAPGQWFAFCGETDMGQTVPALCTECGGDFKLAE